MRNYLKTRFMFVFSSALNAHRWKSVCTQLCMKTTLMRNSNRIISSYFFLRLLLLIIQKIFNTRPHAVHASAQPKQVRKCRHTHFWTDLYVCICQLFTIRFSYAFQFHHSWHVTLRCLGVQLIAPD